MHTDDPTDLAELRAHAAGGALTLFRHPRVMAEGLVYGRTDPPLGPDAAHEIASAARRMRRLRLAPEAILTSPSPRAMALAAGLADALGVGVAADPRLMELDFGAWEGLRWDALTPAERDPWAADPWRRAPPGGEAFGALAARVAAALADAPPGAVMVTHAGVIRAVRILRGGLSVAEALATPAPFAAPVAIPALAR
jgi:alpha-ribazole phosphatase